ncbi:MAG: alpha/beta hydrolase [Jatrophihabitans sp.]|uniref:alpha/beta hydrolase n=1 Tax=Jatrophihabitans sp. TaxID=1932789 RepID=UPI003F814D44
MLDPTLQTRLPLLGGIDPLTAPEEAAERFARFARPMPGYEAPRVDSDDVLLPGQHGPVPVRIYWPSACGPCAQQPALVWCHGGGFVSGDLDMVEADTVARELCVRAGAVVISVDYRLAVAGVHHPVPMDDVVSAWRWAVANADAMGVDPLRVALGGASAGGCLAAGAALALRTETAARPAALLLAYPTLHRELPPASTDLAAKSPLIPTVFRFSPEAVARMNRQYLGDAAAGPYTLPGDQPLDGLPPTLVLTSEYDDLRASGEAFAAALRAADVPTHLRCEPGMLHGHLNLPGLPGALASIEALARHLQSTPVRHTTAADAREITAAVSG